MKQTKHKIKNKSYARPLILNQKDFDKMMHFEFVRLNPNIKIDNENHNNNSNTPL